MSDRRPTRPNDPSAPATRRGAEPEGGSAARRRELLWKSASRHSARRATAEPASRSRLWRHRLAVLPLAAAQARRVARPEVPRLPSDLRRRNVREYHQRQQAQAQQGAGEVECAGDERRFQLCLGRITS